MAVIESNQMRRAHRVDIPIIIVIDSVAYKSKDWSMTGTGIEDLHLNLEIDEIIDASIVLAMQDAKIEMPIKLQLKVKRGDVSGFEFAQISEKNKKVLREFLELSIEGRLDSIDGLLSVYNEPIVDTPIKESVVFSDEEESSLKKAFAKRSKFYIRLGIAFFIVLIATIYYNTVYVYRSIGTISGNFVKISSSESGKISKIYVKVGDKVNANDILFELDDKKILNEIDIIDGKLADLHAQTSSYARDNKSNYQVLKLLKIEMNKKYSSYKSAKILYNSKLIAISDLQRVSDYYSRTKIRYLQEKNRNSSNNNSASIISLMTQLELKKEELINELNYLRVFSQRDGYVYAIKYQEGNYVGSSDDVMVLETDGVSFVVCKLKQEESVKIQNGMKVKIYSASTDKTYLAHIQTVGNLSLNTQSEITNEVSLKEVTIKIVFDNKVRLPLNERVKVWFYRELF